MAITPTELAAASPAEIDALIAQQQAAIYRCHDEIARINQSRRPIPDAPARIRELTARAAETRGEMEPCEAEYTRRGGWARYFLVENGHLHYDASTARCSRVPRTQHYWMTEYSGWTADEVIADAGDRVCTTCFPAAPVEPRPAAPRFATVREAESAAYLEQARRDKAARKAAEIRTPDGEPLIVHGDHLRTERAAWNRALLEAGYLALYGAKDTSARAAVEAILPTLAHMRGTTVDAQREQLNAAIVKKGKRDRFEVLEKV